MVSTIPFIQASDGSVKLFCGPLSVRIHSSDAELVTQSLNSLRLISAPWEPPHRTVQVVLKRGALRFPARGTFLECARMNVDARGQRLSASTLLGLYAQGSLEPESERWTIVVPNVPFCESLVSDFEDILTLVLTTGWRRAGWIPMHAAAVEKDGRCVMLCAPSGCGKSTLTTALTQHGWRTLGDDKLLLRCTNGNPNISALLRTFNLHPQTERWLKNIGSLQSQPRYSNFTEKRRVSMDQIPGCSSVGNAGLTHIVHLSRTQNNHAISVSPMPASELFPTMLRQIVIPKDRRIAGEIMQTVSQATARLCGSYVAIGNDAYANPRWIHSFQRAVVPCIAA
jgi:hypothetical protein